MKSPNFSLPTLSITKNHHNLFLSLLFTLFSLNGFSQQLAFPTAKGAGAYVTGGRGGQVIHVTTLNGFGPGSLTEALNTEGPRTIVFDVGGTIDLTGTGFLEWVNGNQNTNYHNVTVAGQTAPGGITIEAQGLYMDFMSNVIFRHVRFKGNDTLFGNDMLGHAQSNSIIYDHCSFLYGNDECLSIWDDKTAAYGGIGVGNVTVQHCLLGESKTGMIVGGGEANGISNVSILNNAFISISHRFPNPKDPFGGQLDVINNVVYNWKERLVVVNFSGTNDPAPGNIDINNIGNLYKVSSLSGNDWGYGAFASRTNKIMQEDVEPSESRIYTAFNKMPSNGYTDAPFLNDNDLWRDFWTGNSLSTTDYFTTTQFPLLGQAFPIKTATNAWTDVLADVGANAYLNNSHSKVRYAEAADDKMISEALNDNTTQWAGYNSDTHINGSHTGGTRPAGWDDDRDGMPDDWEIARWGDDTSHDGTGDDDADGYTDLEEYLNLIDGAVTTIDVTGVAVSPSTATINIPDTITLTATVQPADASNQSGTWSSNNTAVATVNNNGVVSSVSEGEAIITFNSNSGGFSDSATITVTNIPIGVESVSLTPETLEININTTDVVVATVLPANASDQTGVWTSSNPGVATVDQQGLIQPFSVGETTITFTTNDGGFSDTSLVTTNDDNFGSFDFYNADTDVLIQAVEGGEVFDLDNIGENVNFRIIPLGGDSNPDVESVGIQWNGIENGNYAENAPLYSGMTGHIGNDYEPYTVAEGTYNFTVTYYSEDGQSGNVVATDTFSLSFMRASANQVTASDDSTICQGDTAALIATGANSYLWSTGETSETIAVTPNVTTTYTVTGTHSDGSTSEDTVIVTVNETPTVDAGVDQSVCEGESVVLTATTTAGSITWSNGATTASITVNPANTTTYTVTVDNNGCIASDDVTVNVNALPIANAGNDITIINGESATLTASGGATYAWSTGETTNSIVVNPTVDTTYIVSVTSAAGCSSGDSVVVRVVEDVIAQAGADVSICDGDTTTLTASGGTNYLWSTGETTPSISVGPNATTSYSVTVSNQSRIASDTDSVTVTVFDQPIADVSNDVTIASGQSAELFATGGDTYEWSTGETGNSITVTPTTNTTYTVIVYNAGGCSDEDTVTIYVIEEVIADAGEDVAICEGDSVTLTAAGGETYLWNTGETTESITVSPLNTSTYTVVVSDQYTSDTDDVIVTVNPLPVVSAGDDVTINAGESVTLYGSGGNTYLWSTGDTNANISVSPLQTTTYTISTTINGCSDTDEVTVIVNNVINASAGEDQDACAGADVTLSANGGDSYIWSTGETTQEIRVNPEETTTYTVVATTDAGTGSDDVTINVVTCSLDNDPSEILDFSFRAYPNPNDGDLNVKITGLHTSGVVMVTDILGNNLKYIELEENGGHTRLLNVDLTSIAKGLYLVTLYSDNRTVTKKIVKN